jgi:hypothetical protein
MAFGLSRGFWVTLVVILVVTAAAILLAPLYRVALLGSGYMAHTLCSGMFVSGRDLNDVMAQELAGAGSGELAYFPHFNRRRRSVATRRACRRLGRAGDCER